MKKNCVKVPIGINIRNFNRKRQSVAKKRYILFIKRAPGKDIDGWHGMRGVFFSVRIAEKNLLRLCNKTSNLAEIVDFDTLEIVKVLKKGAGDEWE